MKIFSEKIKYSIIAMLALAKIYSNKQLKQIKEISKENNIPQNFLEQILLLLKKNNLVNSVRGAQGGYMLKIHPKEISLLNIINAVEGTLHLIEYSQEISIVNLIFKELENQFKSGLDISLQSLLNKEQEFNQTLNYTI